MYENDNNKCKERCKCCLEEAQLRDLWSQHERNDGYEIYGYMLVECFALSWEPPLNNSEYICEGCVKRLQNAVSFKKEILCTQQLLLERVKNEQVKEEIESDTEVTPEFFTIQFVSENYDEGEDSASFKIGPTSKPEAKSKKTYSEEELSKCVDAITKDKISQNKASLMFNIPKRAISQALNPTISEKPKKSEIAEKVKTYTDDQLQECIELVKNGTYSQTKAAALYNIPRTTIGRAIRRQESASEKEETIKKKCTEDDVKDQLEVVRSDVVKRENDAKLYEMSCDIIGTKLQRRRATKKKRKRRPISDSYLFPELKNFDSDISVLFDSSNATPIRCKGGIGYKCCFCAQQFPDPRDLKRHTEEDHDKKDISTLLRGRHGSSFLLKLDISYLHCKICSDKMDTLEILINHLIIDHEKNIHKDIKNFVLPFKFEDDEIRCVICNSLFNKFKVLQEHMSSHFRNYICDYCNAGFVTRSILLKHMKCHLTGLFKCNTCPKTYDTVRKKRAHENQVHVQGRMLYKCGYCSQKFNRYQKREEHLVKIHGRTPVIFQCQACDKVLVSQQALRDHTRRDHLLERQHTCSECGLTFFRPSDVRRHMVRHNGVRKFQCDVCLKSYSRLNTLREHLRIHADDRRFKCVHCGLGFVQKCSWRAHMRTKHGEQV